MAMMLGEVLSKSQVTLMKNDGVLIATSGKVYHLIMSNHSTITACVDELNQVNCQIKYIRHSLMYDKNSDLELTPDIQMGLNCILSDIVESINECSNKLVRAC